MTSYRCLVVSAEGRTSWRRIDALDERSASARLAADGLVPLDIRSGEASLWERLDQPVRIGGRMGLADQALILGQLAMLVGSGFPVDRSIDLLRDQSPAAAQRDMLAGMLARVRSGGTLAAALEEAGAFPAYVIGVVRSAERSGRLGEALASVAGRMKLAAATRRQLVTALTYPAAVLAATILALVLVLSLVVPQFEPLFAGNEERLPLLTRVVMGLSRIATDDAALLLLLLVAAPMAAWGMLRTNAAPSLLQRHRGRIPGLRLRDQYMAGRFFGVLATLVENGVPAVSALPLARETMASRRWREQISEAELRIRAGMSLSKALEAGRCVPDTAVRLVEVGERTGRLAETCKQASLILGEAAQARIDRAVSLANPIAIVGLGGLVALLVAGVMLGIFALGDFAG